MRLMEHSLPIYMNWVKENIHVHFSKWCSVVISFQKAENNGRNFCENWKLCCKRLEVGCIGKCKVKKWLYTSYINIWCSSFCSIFVSPLELFGRIPFILLTWKCFLTGPAAFRPRAHPYVSYNSSIEKGRPVLQGLQAIDFLAKEASLSYFLISWRNFFPSLLFSLIISCKETQETVNYWDAFHWSWSSLQLQVKCNQLP